MSGRRLTARDYKHPRRGSWSFDAGRLRDFAIGLGVGLAVAAIVFITDHRAGNEPAGEPAQPVPTASSPDDVGLTPAAPRGSSASVSSAAGPRAAATAAPAAGAHGQPAGTPAPAGIAKYDFYQMLPRFEVVIPAHEHISRVAPAAQIDQPGTYFLQVGSYRDDAVAERVRAQVVKLGISATVQQIAVGHDVWHRVRVGPIRDLATLNHLRHQLQSDKLDSLVIRVEG